MDLGGKVALVTGSTSGIGLGIARALAAQGADILLNGFGEPHQIAALEAELAAAGVRVGASGHDVSRPAEAAAMVEQAEVQLGRLDILINNAGVQHVAPIEDFPDAQWDRVIAINLSGPFYSAKAAIPGMKRRGWGRIINIASAHGLVASGGEIGLRRRETRIGRAHQGHGDRVGGERDYRQRHLPRVGAHTPRAGPA